MRVKKGFTFAEILVVTCIIAVVASVAMPAIDDFMSSQKISSEAELFVSSVREARYKAMQESALHRLVIEYEGTDIIGYKIQIYGEYELKDSEKDDIWNYDSSDEADSVVDESISRSVDFQKIKRSDDAWISILDSDEITFDSSIEVKFTPAEYSTIYFHPSGYLVCGSTNMDGFTDNVMDTNILSETQLILKYGNSQGIIRFNAMGILSSEISEIEEDGGE